MLKILTLFCFALATVTCYAQKTKTPITGIDAIKLGDSINHIDAYGFPFVAVTKYRVSDTSSKHDRPKKILTKDELRKIEYDVEFKTSDSGRTFCPDVSVFISSTFSFNQIQHSKTATLALTYFKNKLIDIRIIDSIKHIRANFMYSLKKYGKGFFLNWMGTRYMIRHVTKP
jgi:hypothetical protein